MSTPSTGIGMTFRERYQRAHERLAAAMAGAAADAGRLLDRLRDELAAVTPGAPASVDAVTAFERLYGEAEQRFFAAPAAAFEQAGPITRTLAAMEAHLAEMTDLARALPEELAPADAAWGELLGLDPARGGGRVWGMRPALPRPLRANVLAQVWRQMDRRAELDEALELVLARCGLHLVAAWQWYRRHQLAELAEERQDAAALAAERQWWLRTATTLATRAQRLAQGYQRWAQAATAEATLSAAVARRAPQLSARRQLGMAHQWQSAFSRWHRQQRAVRTLMDLERQLALAAQDAAAATRQALAALQAEHDGVIAELDGALAWLAAGGDAPQAGAFPPPQAGLLTVEQRARSWAETIAAGIPARVPAVVEVVRLAPGWGGSWRGGRGSRPRSGPRWRQLLPQRVLLQALQHAGLDTARAGLREAEAEHTAIVRDIEHARQVVTFALEAAQAEGGAAPALPQEALANARALLQHRRDILLEPQAAAAAGLGRAQALTLLQTHTALERGRLGLLALLAREGGPRMLGKAGGEARAALQAGSRAARAQVQSGLQWSAWKLGLEPPPAPPAPAVFQQPRLSAILEVPLRARALPALYERLFRLAPVEDPRFLVGREVEMQGLAQAFAAWQAGRRGNVVVVGARGSGKTSLLNCATQTVFKGVPIIRGQFGPRLRTTAALTAFLEDLLGLPAGARVEAALNRGRRIVILEEFERTFLRCMNGFDVVRDFLQLVTATSASTLWILSLNQVSFAYLDAVAGLGRSFSCQVNAMAVRQEQMVEAILQRHTLSGLRLQFAPVPPGDPRVQRLRRFLGLELTPQQMFFEALYRQSEGLFRAAFGLWLGSIERIEGSIVHMLQPLDPDYRHLRTALTTGDLFALHAILQHASLTAAELAEVLGTSPEHAHGQLERLLALEILEPEPSAPGLRVCPQAGRFVRDALGGRNLL